MTRSDDSHAVQTLVGPSTAEAEIKKSRFIAHAAPAESPAKAMAFVACVRDPHATHNCWAYRIGTAYRFSDDGEPAGTAGRPILSAIDHQEIDHAVVVVTRFFGGIKLGAGGLARAYGGAAASCLHHAEKRTFEETIEAAVRVPFAWVSQTYALIQRWGLSRGDEDFDDRGAEFVVVGPRSAVEGFSVDLTEISSGTARVRLTDAEAP